MKRVTARRPKATAHNVPPSLRLWRLLLPLTTVLQTRPRLPLRTHSHARGGLPPQFLASRATLPQLGTHRMQSRLSCLWVGCTARWVSR